MKTSKADRAVLITGANSGFGLACTLEIAKRGYRAIGSVRSASKAEHLYAAADDAGVKVEAVIMDVTDPQACESVMRDLPLYGLVNNAGFGVVGAVEDVSDEMARSAMETMVLAPMRLARLAMPHMRAQGGGKIIGLSSMYGRSTLPLIGWYQAAKHGLEGVSDALRIEVASDNIDVVLVEPGMFKTNILDETHNLADQYPESRYQNAYEGYERIITPIERYSPTPEPVAKLVGKILDIKSPKSRYLIGSDAYASVAMENWLPTRIKDQLWRLVYKL